MLNRTPLGIAVAMVLYGTASAARAADADGDTGLQEIVVTATRRNVSILEIPYSIQAISGQDLIDSGVSDISGLVHLVPGLALFDEGARVSGNRNSFHIRGLNADTANNNDDNPSLVQPAVSTYLGETPVFYPFKLVDMARVEVLRGPQGTLYGASSIGGTVRFVPNAPDPKELTADLNAKVSTTEHSHEPSYDGSLTINIPLTDTSAVRASVGHEYLSGFINAVGLVKQTGTPMNPGSIVLQDPSNFLVSPPATAPPINDYNKANLDYFRGSAKIGLSDDVSVTLNLAYQRTNAAGRNEDNPYYGTGRQYNFYKAFTDPQLSTIKLYDVDVSADLGFATLSSATSATSADTDSVSDSSGYLRTNLASYYAGYPRLYAPIRRTQDTDTYTEEVRLVSKASQMFEWIAGAFFESSHTTYHLLQNAPGINQYTNQVLGLDPALNFTDTLAYGYSATTYKDIAGYGELTWHVTDRWQITGGARVFHETLNGVSGLPLPYASLTTQYFTDGTATNPFLLGGILPVASRTNDHIFKFNTSYKPNDNTLVYATISQGFRSGGANALPASDPFGDDNRPYLYFKPDTDTNYEVGVKGTVADRLSYVATAYLINWQNFQSTLFTPFGVNYVANVGPARSQGLELQIDGKLTKRLAFGLGYTLADAYTRQPFELAAGNPASTVPLHSPLPGSSKNSYSEYLEYTVPLVDSSLLFRADGSYRGPSQSNFANIPSLPSNNYVHFSPINIWNSSISWDKKAYSIALYGENLSSNRGTTLVSAASLYGARDQGWGVIRPRTIGIRVRWSYK